MSIQLRISSAHCPQWQACLPSLYVIAESVHASPRTRHRSSLGTAVQKFIRRENMRNHFQPHTPHLLQKRPPNAVFKCCSRNQEHPGSLHLHGWTNLDVAKVPRLASLRRVCGSALHSGPDDLTERTGQGEAAHADSI